MKQQLALIELISQALEEVGHRPILVGGAAVAYYTQGAYVTADIDFVTPHSQALIKRMQDLGFEKFGKDFVHPELDFYVEFPGSELGPTEAFQVSEFTKVPVRVISLEDLIVDRLCAFKFWHSALDGVNALLLLEQEGFEETRLISRAKEEKVLDALKDLRVFYEKSIRLKLSKKKTNQLLEDLVRKF